MIDIPSDSNASAASPKRPAPLELTRPVNADLQKQIDADVKTIRCAIAGNMRARNLFFAYAAIAGARANHLMEIAPHGEGEKILAQEFPDSRATLHNWRQFAKTVVEKMAVKCPTVGLLTAPSLGKKTIPAKAAGAIQSAVLEVMDGAGMMEFMRASKALKEEGLRGGDRGGSHAPRIPNAEEQREAAETLIAQYTSDIASMCMDKINLNLCSRPKLDALAEAALALRKTIEDIKAEKENEVRTKLQVDLDILADRIKAANEAADWMRQEADDLHKHIATVEQAARDGLAFKFPSKETKRKLLSLLDSLQRCRQLLNSAEPGSRGLAAKNTLTELWREMP